MRVTIKVGDIGVDIRGLKMSRKQVLDMLGEVAGVALALTPEQPEQQPIGFALSAITERAPDEADDYYEEDDDRGNP